jgi:hypothetical protein
VYLYQPHHLYHLHHLYHHDLSEPLRHNSISILGKGRNNTHEGGQLGHNYHTEFGPTKIHQPKSIHHFPVDNPSKYEHHHMSNKIVPAIDQRIKITVFVHPSFQNLPKVVLDLHNSHHHHYEAVRWIVVHEK